MLSYKLPRPIFMLRKRLSFGYLLPTSASSLLTLRGLLLVLILYQLLSRLMKSINISVRVKFVKYSSNEVVWLH